MSVEHAKSVQGWSDESDLTWLHEHAMGRTLVVEFGAWCGRSSIALASAKSLLCVDTWLGSAEHADTIAAGFDPWPEWRRNLSEYKHVRAHRCDLGNHKDVAALVSDVSRRGLADMVFVDASHDYDSVKRDIQTARKLLRSGGLLCGHDYSKHWPEVMKAVDEHVPNRQCHGSIWFAP